MGDTAKHGLPWPSGTDLVSDGDDVIRALAEDIDDLMAVDDQGTLASRPVSSAPSPGKTGCYYFATDTGQLFRDNGTGWDEIALGAIHAPYRTLLSGFMVFHDTAAAGTYPLAQDTAGGTDPSPTNLIQGGGGRIALPLLHVDDADFAVSGKTSKLRVRAQVGTNNTAPGITFTFGLYPVAFSGGANQVVATLGAVVADSQVAIASPPANTPTPGATADLALPADGSYCLGVLTSGALAANAAALLSAHLQLRNV